MPLHRLRLQSYHRFWPQHFLTRLCLITLRSTLDPKSYEDSSTPEVPFAGG
jgi:hypothetical protein